MTREELERQVRTLATRFLVDVLEQHDAGDPQGAHQRVDRFGALVMDELAARRRAELPPPASAGGMAVAAPDDDEPAVGDEIADTDREPGSTP